MNPPKCDAFDYIDILIAHPSHCTATEASRVQPLHTLKAHDSFTSLLHRLKPNTADLWDEVRSLLQTDRGVLILDDTTLDKPYAQAMDLVGYHWSGKHKAVVKGINLLTLLWSDGDVYIPTDYRIYDKPNDQKTKNDHFRELLWKAKVRGFTPDYVLFDSWYSSLDNLKYLRKLGYRWLTRLKNNRLVGVDRMIPKPISECDISDQGTIVYLPGYGQIKVFRIDTKNGDTQYWATDNLSMTPIVRLQYAELCWTIEDYHRGLKQYCQIENCQARKARPQRNHIGLSIRAFVRLEWHRFQTGLSWFQAKLSIIRAAVRAYLCDPRYTLQTEPQPTR